MPEWLFYNLGFLKPLTQLLYDRIWRTMIVDFYDRCDRVIGPTRTTLNFLREHGLQQPATWSPTESSWIASTPPPRC